MPTRTAQWNWGPASVRWLGVQVQIVLTAFSALCGKGLQRLTDGLQFTQRTARFRSTVLFVPVVRVKFFFENGVKDQISKNKIKQDKFHCTNIVELKAVRRTSTSLLKDKCFLGRERRGKVWASGSPSRGLNEPPRLPDGSMSSIPTRILPLSLCMIGDKSVLQTRNIPHLMSQGYFSSQQCIAAILYKTYLHQN